MKQTILLFSMLVSGTETALAHWGHLGEAAGHAHWLGVGAVVAAGVLGALIGKGASKPAEGAPESDPADETGDPA